MSDVRLLARLASVTGLERPWTWRAGEPPSDVRYALFRALESEQEALVASPPARTEPARICALAQQAFGDLAGLVAGLDAAVLDAVPAPGEWSLRETLAHIIGVERSYLANTRHAALRADDEPLQLPAERRPQPLASDTRGDAVAILERLAAYRAESDEALGALDEGALARPSQWGKYEVDVRFRLHRFASHLVEHAGQCEKVLDATGHPPSEARRIVRRIGAARGAHERASGPARVAALDAALDRIATSIGV